MGGVAGPTSLHNKAEEHDAVDDCLLANPQTLVQAFLLCQTLSLQICNFMCSPESEAHNDGIFLTAGLRQLLFLYSDQRECICSWSIGLGLEGWSL